VVDGWWLMVGGWWLVVNSASQVLLTKSAKGEVKTNKKSDNRVCRF
jgi:hypothetical protein